MDIGASQRNPVPAISCNVKDGYVVSLKLSSHPGQGLVPTLQGRHGTPGERRWHLWHLKLGDASAAGKVRIKGPPSCCVLVWEEEGAGLEVDCGLMETGTTLWFGKHGKTDTALTAMSRPCCLYDDGTLSPADAPHLVFGFDGGWAVDCGGKHRAQHSRWPAVLVPRGDARSLKIKALDSSLVEIGNNTANESDKGSDETLLVPAISYMAKENDVLPLELSSHPGRGLVPTLQGRHGTPGDRRWHLWHLKLGDASAAGKVRIKGPPSCCVLVWEEEGAGLEVDCGVMETGTTLWFGKHGKTDTTLTAMSRPCCLYDDGTLSPADAPHLVFGFDGGWAVDCGGKHRAQHSRWPAVLVPRGDARSLKIKAIDSSLVEIGSILESNIANESDGGTDETPPLPAISHVAKEDDVLPLELSSHPGQGLVLTLQGRHGTPGKRRWHLWHLKLGDASAAGRVRIKGPPGHCVLVWEEEGAGLGVDCGLMETGTTLWFGKHGETDTTLTAMARPCCLYDDGTLSPADAPHLVFGFDGGWAVDCGGKHRAQHSPWPAVLVPRGDARSLKIKALDSSLVDLGDNLLETWHLL